jgi:hypothetical protein
LIWLHWLIAWQALATLHHLQKLCSVVGGPEEHAEFRSNFLHFNAYLAESAKFQALLRHVASNVHTIPSTEVNFPPKTSVPRKG